MEVASADHNFGKFRSEGMKWLKKNKIGLEEAFLNLSESGYVFRMKIICIYKCQQRANRKW